MSFLNDGRFGNWVCYIHGNGSLACCVQLNQRGPEHISGRLATRGFDSPEEAFEYLAVELGQELETIRFFVSSPKQFYLTQCASGPQLPFERNNILRGLNPIQFEPF
jgi:hypothetical protein